MINSLKRKLIQIRFIQNLLLKKTDLSIFKEKPSTKFIFGIGIVGFSYIIGWPMVSLLGVLAFYFKEPLLFAIGSPIAYGFSHLVFMLGIFIAGKDTVVYMNTFGLWSINRFLTRFFGVKLIEEYISNKPKPDDPSNSMDKQSLSNDETAN